MGLAGRDSRREEEAMSLHIVDDEQRGDRPAIPMRPSGSGGARNAAPPNSRTGS